MKLSSCVLSIYNVIRFSIVRIKSKKRFVMSGLCFVKPNTSIILGKGKIALGKSVVIETNGYISTSAGGDLVIGDRTFINRNCYIACRKSISIGNDCIIGPNVSIYDHNHKYVRDKIYKNEYTLADVIIEDGCWIGDGAKILKGTHIGRCSIIGAGVVVKTNIEAHSIVKNDNRAVISKL